MLPLLPVQGSHDVQAVLCDALSNKAGIKFASAHLHLELLGAGGLQLGGDGALQSVSLQSQALAAVVGDGQNLTLHGLPIHPVTLRRKQKRSEANRCTAPGGGRRRKVGDFGRTLFDNRRLRCKKVFAAAADGDHDINL